MQDYVAGVQQFVVDALFGHSHACSVVSVHCSLGAFSNDHLLVFSLAVACSCCSWLSSCLAKASLSRLLCSRWSCSSWLSWSLLKRSLTRLFCSRCSCWSWLSSRLLARLAPSRCCRCSSLSPCLLKRSLTRLFSKLSWWLRGWFVVVAAFSIEWVLHFAELNYALCTFDVPRTVGPTPRALSLGTSVPRQKWVAPKLGVQCVRIVSPWQSSGCCSTVLCYNGTFWCYGGTKYGAKFAHATMHSTPLFTV